MCCWARAAGGKRESSADNGEDGEKMGSDLHKMEKMGSDLHI
jgi:hypothetical protein